MYGAIGFSRRRWNLLSRAICWLTRSKYSHVFIVVDDAQVITKETMILQASGFRVGYGAMFEYLKPGIDFELWLVGTEEERREALRYAKTFIGEPYGFFQLFGFLPVLLLRRLGIKIKNPVSYGVPCSELEWRYANAHASLHAEAVKHDRDTFSPADALEIIKATPNAWKVEVIKE